MGFKVDNVSKFEVTPTLLPAVRTTGNVDGTTVSLENAHSAVFVVTANTITNGDHTIVFQESFDGGDNWSAIDADDLSGTVPVIDSDGDEAVWTVGYKGGAGMIRARAESADAAAGGVIGVNVILGHRAQVGGSPILT